MPENQPAQDQGDATPAPAFDANKFREEILSQTANQNRLLAEQIQGAVLSTVQGMMSANKAAESPLNAPTQRTEMMNEFAQEMQELQIDESQAGALLRMFGKFVSKQAPDLEQNILNKVDKTIDVKDKKKELENDVKRQYPDIINQQSPLFAEAQKVFANMSQEAKNAYDSTANAVKIAASNLGIQALSVQQILSQDAHTETGVTGGSKKAKNDEPNESQLGFAESFGINKNLFKEKLKLVQNRR